MISVYLFLPLLWAAALIWVVLRDHAQSLESLGVLFSLADLLQPLAYLVLPIAGYWDEIVILSVLIGLALCASNGRRRYRLSLFGYGVLFVAFAQFLLFHRTSFEGVLAYVVGAMLLYRGSRFAAGIETQPSPSRPELLFAALILCLGVLARLLALNTLPSEYEDEMAFFFNVDTTVYGTLIFGLGAEHPLGGPGLFWHFFHWVTATTLGLDYITLRIGGVMLGIVSMLLQCLVCRRVFGVWAGIFMLLIVSFSTLEFEWSRLDNWHFHPGLWTILVFWSSWEHLTNPSRLRFALMVLCVAGASLLYPSGILPGLMPIGASILRMCPIDLRPRATKDLVLLVLIALPLWRLLETIIYFIAFGELRWFPISGTHFQSLQYYTQGTNVYETLINTFEQIVVLTQRFFSLIFYAAIDPSHWAPLVGSAPPRTAVSSAAAVLGVIGLITLIRREWSSPRAVLVLSWLPLSVIAAFYSNEIDSRRLGTFFVAWHLLAAYGGCMVLKYAQAATGSKRAGAYITLSCLGCVFLSIASTQVYRYFSQPRAIPVEHYIAVELRRYLKEKGTLIAYASSNYRQNQILSLLSDEIVARNGEVAWVSLDGFELDSLGDHPVPQPESWIYRYTQLRQLDPERLKHSQWRGLVIATDSWAKASQHGTHVAEEIKRKWPAAKEVVVHLAHPLHDPELRIFLIDIGKNGSMQS